MNPETLLSEFRALDGSGRKDKLMEILHHMSHLLAQQSYRTRMKPLFGPTWGSGLYSLASRHSIDGGLDCVTYYVVDTGTRFVLSANDTKADAIENAKDTLAVYGARIQQEIAKFYADTLAARKQRELQWEEESERRRAQAAATKVKSIPRRRQQIFDADNGKCHYCGTALTLDGTWHIEHKHPRALGGGNEPGNLVASCVPCNMKKRDTTDVEFKARLAKEKAA